ncbi:MAG: glycosyltransferase [Deltaproteobacteria bacterium]|nr:glycosyltransferase [Deltaproteobacteria bacterium]
MNLKLTVHVVTSERLHLLQRCCRSVLAALPKEAQLVVTVNGRDEASCRWLSQNKNPALRYSVVPFDCLPVRRNEALDMCSGDILYCLDDDVEVPNDLFKVALDEFEKDADLAILGGPNITPPESSFLEKLFGAVMTSAFAAPMIRVRYGGGSQSKRLATERELIFCNLAIRKSSIPSGIQFRKCLKANEENVFLSECRSAALKTVFLPKLAVYHRRRKDVSGFFQQVCHYGVGRGQQWALWPQSCHPAFLVPALAIALACGLIVTAYPFWLAVALVIHQASSLIFAYFSGVRSLGWKAMVLAGPLTGLIHLAHGLGFWKGCVLGLRQKFQPGTFLFPHLPPARL